VPFAKRRMVGVARSPSSTTWDQFDLVSGVSRSVDVRPHLRGDPCTSGRDRNYANEDRWRLQSCVFTISLAAALIGYTAASAGPAFALPTPACVSVPIGR
jgi:hypothetical protein